MDYLDAHYYQLNRKLLLIVGQWPYQRYADRIRIWGLYLFIVISAMLTQVAKIHTAEVDFDLCVEIFSDYLLDLLGVVRYFLHTVHNENIKTLVNQIKLTWESLLDEDEHELFGQVAEDGRLYCYHYLVFVYSSAAVAGMTLFSQPLLKYVHLLNDSYRGNLLYPAEYFVDEQKYYYLILGHMSFVFIVHITVIMACDTCVMMFIHHTVGIFKLASFSEAYDHFYVENVSFNHAVNVVNFHTILSRSMKNLQLVLCGTIAATVWNMHLIVAMKKTVMRQESQMLSKKLGAPCAATDRPQDIVRSTVVLLPHVISVLLSRYSDTLSATLAWPNFISVLLVLTNITVTLYWAATSKEQGTKMILGIFFSVTQMLHVLIIEAASQKIADSSEEVIHKAYSSMWYMAPVKDQTLILLSMQRGLKPSVLMVGKFYPLTLAYSATEVKTSVSYFTVLMSLK